MPCPNPISPHAGSLFSLTGDYTPLYRLHHTPTQYTFCVRGFQCLSSSTLFGTKKARFWVDVFVIVLLNILYILRTLWKLWEPQVSRCLVRIMEYSSQIYPENGERIFYPDNFEDWFRDPGRTIPRQKYRNSLVKIKVECWNIGWIETCVKVWRIGHLFERTLQ